jgi:hypothetical protein
MEDATVVHMNYNITILCAIRYSKVDNVRNILVYSNVFKLIPIVFWRGESSQYVMNVNINSYHIPAGPCAPLGPFGPGGALPGFLTPSSPGGPFGPAAPA